MVNWPTPHFPANLATLTEEILNGKLHFLCIVSWKVGLNLSLQKQVFAVMDASESHFSIKLHSNGLSLVQIFKHNSARVFKWVYWNYSMGSFFINASTQLFLIINQYGKHVAKVIRCFKIKLKSQNESLLVAPLFVSCGCNFTK